MISLAFINIHVSDLGHVILAANFYLGYYKTFKRGSSC